MLITWKYMTFTQKSLFRSWKLLVFIFFTSSSALLAQTPCSCTNCPQFMPDGFTGSFFLNVQNACNPTLGQNGQAVCGVRLHLEHEYIGDLRIQLTSPGGQTITLIGPVGFFGGTDFTDWDITFVPCGTPAAPDAGFANIWNNNQAWGLNGNYSGDYYPNVGCLENFTGPVNGTWTMTVFDQQAIDVGTFFDYEIIFCDPSCIDCFTCAANAGALTQPDVTACEGAATLNLNVPPSYTAPNVAPPAADYDYTYVVSQNPGGTIIGYDPDADLSGFPPGSYTVCGLSYLTGDDAFFPPPGSMTTAQLLAQLNSSSPPFCGKVTSNCVNVTINPGVNDIVVSKDLCAPQCTTFYGTTYCATGTYVKNLTQNGCPYKATLILNVIQPVVKNIRDTICEGNCSIEPGFPNACAAGVYTRTLPTSQPDQCDTTVRLTVVQLVTNVVIQPPGQLNCNQPSLTLIGTGSSPGTYLWTASNGGHITGGTSGTTATIDEPGTYMLRVCRTNPSGAACCDSATVNVTEVVTMLNNPTVINGPASICQGATGTYSTPPVSGATTYTWTFPPGVVVNSGAGTNTVAVTWNNSTGGNVCVTASNSCSSSTQLCIPVTVNPTVVATQPQGNATVCGNSNVTYTIPANPNVTNYTWTVTGGTVSTGQGTNSITVHWGTGATGTVCVKVTGPCGTSPDVCLPVQITGAPALPNVIGNATACATGTGTYTVTPVAGATSYHWFVTNGTITSGNGTTSVQVTWDANVNSGSICANAQNACDSSAINCFNVTLNAPPATPVVTGDATLCSGTNGNYSITAIPNSTGYAWTVTGGTIVSGQNTTSLVVNWGSGTGGTVCAQALSTCGPGPQGCFPVVVKAVPNANAGSTNSTCALSINLQAVNSVTGSTGLWTTVSGTGTATFGNASSPTSSVTVTQSGQYVFRWTESNGNCTDDATVTINFNSNPIIGQVTTLCEGTNQNYTVSFQISGGTPPYSVPGGTVTGNTFTSNFIVSGQTYSFVVTDANGCFSPATTGSFNCNCTSEAGTMNLQVLSACEGQSVTAQHLGGDTLDLNDVSSYVLHTNSGTSLGNIIAQNNTGTFSFLPSMSYETTYYISFVVGNDLAGVPDPTDQCLSVAQGQPVIFHQNPVSNAGADDEICGLTIALAGNAGSGTWSVANAPSGGTITFNDLHNNTTSITASTNGTYTLTWTLDNSGCTDSDDVVISFNSSPVAGTVTPTCDPANENYTITIPISGGEAPYSVNGTAITGNTFVSAPIVSGQTYSFTITDANGCAAPVLSGSFNCSCTSAAGQMSLTQLSACQGDSVAANHLGGQTLDGNDVTAYVLHTNSGSSLGTVIAQNHTGIFSFQPGMIYGVTYYVSFVVGNDLNGFPNPADFCLSVAQGQPVVFYQNPVANAGADDSVCGSVITLAGSGTGTGQWTVTSAVNGTLNIADPQNQASDVTASAPGQYTLTWTLTQNGCTSTDDVVLTFNENPSLADILRQCDAANENYTVTLTIQGGTPPYLVNGSAIADSVYVSAPIPNGLAYLYAITDANSCNMPDISGSFNCNCATDAGTMSAATLTACEGTTVQAVANADDTLDGNDIISYVLHNGTGQALGTIYAQNTTGTFGLEPGMSFGVTYYISRVAGNPLNGFPNPQDPCFSVAPGQPVVFLQNPTPDAGQDAAVCGQSFDLQAVVSGYNGVWTQISTNGTAVFADTGDANSTVTVDSFGTYIFQWEESNGICVVSDQVEITFNESPTVNAIDETCNGTNTQYTVTFSVSGGTAPYSTVGIAGTFSGNNFTSVALPNNSVYSFTVEDANGCESEAVTGIKNCNCQTDAGTMDVAPVAFCADQPATATWNNDATTDADDIVLFILHNQSGSSVGTIYATSDQPTFSFGAGLQTGVTYYISAIAGNGVNGNIDQNDPCLSVASGTPVQWRPLPNATLFGDATICDGSSTPLQFTGTGNYPLTVTYSDGVTNNSTVTIGGQQGTTIDVSPSSTTTYTLISVSSGSNPTCTTDLNQSVTVNLNQGLSAGTPNEPVEFCQGISLPIQLINLLTGADPGGTWAEVSTVPSLAGGFNIQTGTFLTNGQPPGTYEFRYTRTSLPPCPDDEAVVQVIINPLPVADAGPDKQLNCLNLSANLGGPATSSGAGITYDWRLDTAFVGNTRNLITSNAGVYTLLVTNSAACTASDAAIVTIDDELPFADIISVKDVRCWGDKDGSISVDSFTSSHPPVLFSLNGGPFTSQTLYTALLPGEYTITLQDANGCEWTSDAQVVHEPSQLMVDLGANINVVLGDSVHLEALINVPFAFLDTLYWNPVYDTAKANTLYQDFLPFASHYIDLRIIDTNGCATSDRTLLVVNQERHVFIPNIIKVGSAENDVLTVFGGRDVAEVELLQVFDRWGDQMFEEGPFMPNDITKGWKGNFKGKEVNPGVYIYTAVVRFIDGEKILFKGDVTVFK
ncbi:MAG TPA: proprotein convertase P-domain-containing protein [Saprospiraceae bacterium]|nr:proprotein convertase P-domain-containing protein [Saprospiraceae bacterium]